MTESGFLWLRERLSWVGLGFIHRLPSLEGDEAILELRSLGFEVFRLDGAKICDQESFHHEAAGVFGFPSYYGKNWDAFDECFSELNLSKHVAIVWAHADVLAKQDLKVFAEAICILEDHAKAVKRERIQLAIFISYP
jgi:RNAse (barnase) inhibitor barstar